MLLRLLGAALPSLEVACRDDGAVLEDDVGSGAGLAGRLLGGKLRVAAGGDAGDALATGEFGGRSRRDEPDEDGDDAHEGEHQDLEHLTHCKLPVRSQNSL
jgi:hypothetical protein